ncbi:MAG: UbiX family flavin prenyltransferase [Coriobacteriia bacterium]|nr:UbiX family flavin prenyltransferase [Coriobacteriia bacterium]
MGKYAVVITGASGSAYGMRLIEQLALKGHETTIIFSDAGRDVAASELGFELPIGGPGVAAVALAAFLELPSAANLRVVGPEYRSDRIVSDTYRLDAMIVAPCSMGFVAGVAHGLVGDLSERAADFMLKERRPLVLVPLETPLSLIHLRNLTAAAEAGAIVVPAMPAFYHRPTSVDDLIGFVVGKVLDVLGMKHDLLG